MYWAAINILISFFDLLALLPGKVSLELSGVEGPDYFCALMRWLQIKSIMPVSIMVFNSATEQEC